MATLDTHASDLYFPPAQAGTGLDQDEEWCEIEIAGERRRIRLHDYGAIYAIPGLYEQIFYDRLDCQSPRVVCGLLAELLEREGVDPGSLRALDFGAGNGMVGELLAAAGIEQIDGIDLLPEARDAALRDRPGLYDDYHVLDLSTLDREERRELSSRYDVMSCVAALGFGDVPPIAFAEAFNMVHSPGWVAFNIRERFLDAADPAGFGAFIGRMLAEGVLEERARVSYTHRVSVAGKPLPYLAIVATKRCDVPLEWARR